MDEPSPPPLLQPPPLLAPPAPPPSLRRPSAWPVLLGLVGGQILDFVVAGTAVGLLALAMAPKIDPETLQAWLEEHAGELPTILALLVPGQLTLLAVAILAAVLSRERPLASRLGFVKGSATFGVVLLAALGALGVQFAIDLVAEGLIDEPSPSLRMIARMFTEPQGAAAVVVALSMSVLPGICEEAFFRGFGMRGLLRSWSPLLSIFVTSALFALAHFDVQHSSAVFPLGAWFGFVAWRTGSLWPAVACHFLNNITAIVTVRLYGDAETLAPPHGAVFFAVGAVCLLCTVLATVVLMRRKPPAG